MSDKLIKASDAVDIVAKHSSLYGDGEINTDDGEALLYDIMSEIMNLPSAQPEIVRCKDCEYYHPYYCEKWSMYGTVQTQENGFCYMAERRADETN